MDALQTLIGMLASAARSVWAGVLGAVVVGYLGRSVLGFPGFLIGAGLGAVGGTWAAVQLGLVSIKRLTGSRASDQLLYAGGAFALVAAGYFMLYLVMVLATLVALGALVMFWVSM